MRLLILLLILAPAGVAQPGGSAASPAYIRFDAPGGVTPATQSVTFPVSGATAWTAAGTAPWLTVSPASGTGAATLTLSAQPSGMLPGMYSDLVTLTSGGAAIATVPVTLGVSAASGVPIFNGNQWYASPDGTANGDGSQANPWDIVTAFDNAPHAVKPGDTIWLRGGKYGDGSAGAIIAYGLVGKAAAPILVRAYPGERPIIDAWLQVGCCDQAPDPNRGAYVWFWGIEFASFNPDRHSGTSGPPEWAAQANHAAVDTWAPGTKIINCIVHDTAGGISMWDEAPGSEAYGNIVYNVGGYGTDRGHGHGFYMQNQGPGYKHVADNITFNNFGEGMQMFGTDTAYVQNFHLEGNVSMNNGSLGLGTNTTNGTTSAGARDDNIIIASGNGGPAGIVVINNYTYHTPLADDGYNDLSYNSTPIANDVTAVGNYLYEPGRANVVIYNWDLAPTVPVDLSTAGVNPGDTFEIHDGENWFAPALVSGTYNGGTVAIPMTGLQVALPNGVVPNPQPHTAPQFGVFVVLSGDASAAGRRTGVHPPVLRHVGR
jgi:hypothetical protein